MHCTISKERNHENAFAVCILPTPEFPMDKPSKCYVQKLAVIAANDDKGAWGFVTLKEDEKDCIGFAMMQFRAETGRWYWCELYKDE